MSKRRYQRYELTIKCMNRDYIDTLIVALARQGFEPYLTDGENVHIAISSEDIWEIRE